MRVSARTVHVYTYYVRRPCPLPDMTVRDTFFRTIIVCGLAMVVTVQAFSNNAYPMVTRHVRRNVGDVPVALFTHRPMLLIKPPSLRVLLDIVHHRRIPRNEKSVRCSSRVLVEIPLNYGQPWVGGVAENHRINRVNNFSSSVSSRRSLKENSHFRSSNRRNL